MKLGESWSLLHVITHMKKHSSPTLEIAGEIQKKLKKYHQLWSFHTKLSLCTVLDNELCKHKIIVNMFISVKDAENEMVLELQYM